MMQRPPRGGVHLAGVGKVLAQEEAVRGPVLEAWLPTLRASVETESGPFVEEEGHARNLALRACALLLISDPQAEQRPLMARTGASLARSLGESPWSKADLDALESWVRGSMPAALRARASDILFSAQHANEWRERALASYLQQARTSGFSNEESGISGASAIQRAVQLVESTAEAAAVEGVIRQSLPHALEPQEGGALYRVLVSAGRLRRISRPFLIHLATARAEFESQRRDLWACRDFYGLVQCWYEELGREEDAQTIGVLRGRVLVELASQRRFQGEAAWLVGSILDLAEAELRQLDAQGEGAQAVRRERRAFEAESGPAALADEQGRGARMLESLQRALVTTLPSLRWRFLSLLPLEAVLSTRPRPFAEALDAFWFDMRERLQGVRELAGDPSGAAFGPADVRAWKQAVSNGFVPFLRSLAARVDPSTVTLASAHLAGSAPRRIAQRAEHLARGCDAAQRGEAATAAAALLPEIRSLASSQEGRAVLAGSPQLGAVQDALLQHPEGFALERRGDAAACTRDEALLLEWWALSLFYRIADAHCAAAA